MAHASASTEPRTLEEMHARYRAAQVNNLVSARRHNERKRQPLPTPQPHAEVRRPVVAAKQRPGAIVTAQELRLAAMLPSEDDEAHPVRMIARIATEHGLPAGAITGKSRTKIVVAARFAAIMAVQAAHPHLSLPQIGRLFGKRDHTTILNALRRMNANRDANEAQDEASAEAARELLCATPDPEKILDLVAKAYGTTVRHLRGSSRSKRLVAPRRVAIVAIKAAHPLLSSVAIGRFMNREHSSVVRVLKLQQQKQAPSPALSRKEEGSR